MINSNTILPRFLNTSSENEFGFNVKDEEGEETKNSFLNDLSLLKFMEKSIDCTKDSILLSDDEFEELTQTQEEHDIQESTPTGPMFASYQWGSGNFLNSCAVDTFLEIMYHLYMRHGDIFMRGHSKALTELTKSFAMPSDVQDLHNSKVLFWNWLCQEGGDDFQPGKFISLSAIFETFLNGLIAFEERQAFKIECEKRTTCSLYSEHNSNKMKEMNILYITKNNFQEYMKENENLGACVRAEFNFKTIEVKDIRAAFAKVKTAKSFGIDNISSYFLKLALPFIGNSLAALFNTSIETSQFPDSWKVARVTPIFKEGDKTEKSNYRSISVLPVISRLFEKLVLTNCISTWKKTISFLLTSLASYASILHLLVYLKILRTGTMGWTLVSLWD